jgi:glycosyltransferase involved in cell wall biosynthesis
MRVVHLAASAFVGGPESQVLGMIGHLSGSDHAAVLSFSERGRCRALLEAAGQLGAETVELTTNAPHHRAAVAEVAAHLKRLRADVVVCHGYKPDILGLFAARRAGVPAVAVAHGWTAATWKVRLNEALDRLVLRGMDRVVCVSEAQARRVRRAGVPARQLVVIRNAIDPARFDDVDPAGRAQLRDLFPDTDPDRPRLIVGSVGRLSPEKGFGVLVEAASRVMREVPDAGFIHFGDGPLRPSIQQRILALGLERRFVLAGFRADVHRAFPHFDLFALPSYTEGLPCVVLEAFAARVPVVATAVGGTPEVVADGQNGRLVPPGDPESLARRIVELLRDPARPALGERGRRLVLDRFTFEVQARAYRSLFASLPRVGGRSAVVPSGA